MHQLALYLLGLIGFKALRKSIVVVMAASLVTMIVSFYAFSLLMIIEVYNLVNKLIEFNFPKDTVFTYFYDVCNAMGLVDGFLNGMPFIFSAIVFVLSKILFNHTLEVLKVIFYIVKTTLEN